ncbi:hypothetical protein [Streptomyces sp. ISL-11]|uniref:hypothetical protein n=1 Tax=Streptomyces sp. ISL-11 TaxID=2819174 RepID=UPI001BE61132|nr:hypothetical protein [Streptomyces sp. ISL-11]MBT2384600.1 hypothetical protein [Streptomyces sp. ISL-11]
MEDIVMDGMLTPVGDGRGKRGWPVGDARSALPFSSPLAKKKEEAFALGEKRRHGSRIAG